MSKPPLPAPKGCRTGLPPRGGGDGLGGPRLMAAVAAEEGELPLGPAVPAHPGGRRGPAHCPAPPASAHPPRRSRHGGSPRLPATVRSGPVPSGQDPPPSPAPLRAEPAGDAGGGAAGTAIGCRRRRSAPPRPAPAAFRNGAGGTGGAAERGRYRAGSARDAGRGEKGGVPRCGVGYGLLSSAPGVLRGAPVPIPPEPAGGCVVGLRSSRGAGGDKSGHSSVKPRAGGAGELFGPAGVPGGV